MLLQGWNLVMYPRKANKRLKDQLKKDFALRKSDYYALKCVEVIAVDPKAKALIVKDTDGNKVELDITARTTSSSGKKITLEDDIKVGNKISATFYGITKLKGKVDNIDIERSSRQKICNRYIYTLGNCRMR